MTSYIDNVVQELNRIEFKGMGGLKLGTANFLGIHDIINHQFQWKSFVKALILIMFRSYNYDFSKIYNKIAVFAIYSYKRRIDNMKMLHNIETSVKNSVIFMGSIPKLIGNFTIDFNGVKIFFLAPIWLYQVYDINVKLNEKIRLIMLLADNYKWYEMLRKNSNQIKSMPLLITFFDVLMFDSILVQYCDSLHVPTATLQHGHFQEWESNDESGMSGYAYRNSLSDYFLAWGEYSKQEAIASGMNGDKVLCVGNPAYIDVNKFPMAGPHNVFGLILAGGKDFDKYNAQMIELANKLAEKCNMKYIIKTHPGSGTQDFKNHIKQEYVERICPLNETVFSFAESVSFALTLYSTVYSELLFLKVPVFRYVPENTIDLYKRLSHGLFNDYKELVNVIQELQNNPENIKKQCAENKRMLFVSGNIADNYRNAIAKIIQDGKITRNANIQ